MENKNIFTDLRDFATNIRKGWGQMAGDEAYVKTAYYDNPNHIYDNLLKFFKFVLYACAAASLFFGISYHYKLFTQTGQGENISLALAVLLFLIAEVTSVFIGVLFFRFMWTGKMWSSLQHLIFFVIMGVLIYKAFDFRMGISAKAYAAQNASDKKVKLAQRGVSASGGLVKSSIDADIAEARATIEKGKRQTWAGKLTPDGETIVKEGNKTLQKLLILKNKEVDGNIKADSVLNGTLENVILENQKQLNGYGGMVEWAVLILTCLIALLEKISYLENKKDENLSENDNDDIENSDIAPNQQHNIGFKMFPPASTNNSTNQKPFAEAKTGQVERTQIGFKRRVDETKLPITPVDDIQEKKNFMRGK